MNVINIFIPSHIRLSMAMEFEFRLVEMLRDERGDIGNPEFPGKT